MIEFVKMKAIYVGKHLARMDEAGSATGGKVYLGDVTGNDHLAAFAQPGQKHHHLGSGRVLGFVQKGKALA